VLPFDHAELDATQAATEIGDALNNLDLTTMLFLRSTSRIRLSGVNVADATLNRSVTARSNRSDQVTLTLTAGDVEQSEWYVWSRTADIEDALGLSVQIALAIDPHGAVTGLSESPLVVFFPTEKETYLGFLAQGPYRTTPARDNIPHHNAWNQRLVEETAQLLRTALLDLRDDGLLGVNVLSALPIEPARFPSNSMFRPIYDVVRQTLLTETLIPTMDGGHANVSEVRLARSGTLRGLLTGEQFGRLFGTDRSLRWVNDSISEIRTPTLWRYFRDELRIEEVTPQGVVNRLTEDFLSTQTDAWIVDLYRLLGANAALWRKSEYGFVQLAPTKPIVRLEDGSQVRPFDPNGIPLAYLPSGVVSEFPTVRTSIAEDNGALGFLRALGLVEPDIIAEVLDIILPRYANLDAEKLDWNQHQSDLSRISRALKEVTSDRSDRLRSQLRSTTLLRTQNCLTGEIRLSTPYGAYLTSPTIMAYFEANPAAWIVSAEYEPWTQLLRDLGVVDHPRISARSSDRRNYVNVESWHGWHRRGVDRFDPDAKIDGLEFALGNPSLERARYVWNELLAPFHHLVAGTVESSTRKEYIDAERVGLRSALGQIAASSAWLPSSDGRWSRPDQLNLGLLPADFKRDEILAEALGMSRPVLEEAARELDLSPETLRRLKEPMVRAAFNEFMASLLPDSAEEGSGVGGEGMMSLDIEFDVALSGAFDRSESRREAADASSSSGQVSDAGFRRQRTRESIDDDRADESLVKDRFRVVPRQIWEGKDMATRHFIEEQYSGQCQMCDSTFVKRDGRPYFEAVYLVSRAKARWIDRPGNVLCLCATCSAKLRHGRVEGADVVSQVLRWRTEHEGGNGSQLSLRVCGVEAYITFTEKHLLDLQEMLTIG
jgi:hypothetical protein